MSRKKSLNREVLSTYVHASLENRHLALLASLNPVSAILMNVGIPFYAGHALTSTIHNDADFKKYVMYLVVVAALGVITNRVGFVNLMKLQAITMSRLHAMVFSRLLHRGSSFHTNNISGKLISDALDFVSSYGTLLNAAYNTAISLAATLLIGLLVITVNSWQLGLFVFVTVLIIVSWAIRDSFTRHELRTVRLEATHKLVGHLSDSLVNAQTVKTFAAENREIATNNTLNDELFRLRMKDWRRSGVSGNNRIAVLLTMVVLLVVLIHQTAHSSQAVFATGIFAFTYTFTLMLRLFDINTLSRQIEECFLQATPIVKILQEADEVTDVPHARTLNIRKATVNLVDVNFKYIDKSGEQQVFDSLNLTIPAGQKVGLVGPSGGGKTTLTRLLLRFEDINDGSISIDDQNIALVSQASLRQAIAYVPQEPLLFHRSIKENIAYGKPESTQAQVVAAAKKAYAHDFITNLPKGYETVVGERGVKLSGGQRQRVAIARAMLKNAPILILDEATSALDSESEKVIQQALWQLMEDKTAIVIAHRLSTIQKLDRIVVLDNGKIIEDGTHQDLLKNNGLYAKLWKHQSGGFIEE